MKLLVTLFAGCLMLAPALAQENYDFLKRDNPFDSAEQQQQPGAFGFCWTLGPLPNTKQFMITNVFQTQQSASTLAAEINGYERSQGINASFECAVDTFQIQQSRFGQKISGLSQQGYDIGQIKVRPH